VKTNTNSKTVWGSRVFAGVWVACGLGAACLVLFTAVAVGAQVRAQQPVAKAPQQPADAPADATASGALPAGYVIGPDDLLSVVFWRDKDMSADVVVRPDGKISLPLLNDVDAAGLTPDELRAKLTKAASKYVEEPNATVVVKEIRSRKVFITGNVAKPGNYPLNGDMTVLQLIAVAGGLQEYADSGSIVVMRTENGQQKSFKFNYKDVIKQRHVEQNIPLKAGDTVVVP
jgi:polysaccharide export outer membrane protein